MARPRYNRYQYETSPRKLEPEYEVRKQVYPKKSTAIKNKPKKQLKNKSKLKKIVYVLLAFSVLYAICYRNSQINETFSDVQEAKAELSELEKQNEQLNVSIQNSINLNQIEQSAKVLLGMQKLTSKQTIYVNLPKRDYVEPATEEIIMEEEEGGFNSIFEKIKGIFHGK